MDVHWVAPSLLLLVNVYIVKLENNQNIVDTQSLLSANCFCSAKLRVEPFYCVC